MPSKISVAMISPVNHLEGMRTFRTFKSVCVCVHTVGMHIYWVLPFKVLKLEVIENLVCLNLFLLGDVIFDGLISLSLFFSCSSCYLFSLLPLNYLVKY